MTPLFAKLNWKGHAPICVIDAPASFDDERAAMAEVEWIESAPDNGEPLPFLLAFVTTRQRVGEIAALVDRNTQNDAIVWLAYPKKSSRRYASEVARDTGWEPLRAIGFDTVRQIAIDEDWSALRFRRMRYIVR
ncbi:MAG: hypothetical protein ACJ8GK_00870 [Luteimonas sp.]